MILGHVLLHNLKYLSLHCQKLCHCWLWLLLIVVVVVVVVVIVVVVAVSGVGHLMIEQRKKIEIKGFPTICIKVQR